MQQQARRGAKAAPCLAVNWLTARTSPALERTLTGHDSVGERGGGDAGRAAGHLGVG